MKETSVAANLDTPERLAARMLCIGFEGHTLPATAQELFAGGVGFAVLFARNVASPQQVAELNASIKAAAAHPVMICVDQEGGRVRRLRDGFTPIPSARDIGHAALEEAAASLDGALHSSGNGNGHSHEPLAQRVGTVLGTELRAVGCDIAFAPVLDVDTNPLNPVIADRSLGRDPHDVARLGCELVAGIQSAGVAACGKHFPGHGDTSQDSHFHLPRLDHDLQRLNEVELVPFVAAARAGIGAMMSSHIVFAPLDPDRPATLSPVVLNDLLRDQLGYDGVVFTDDMEMKAIANFYDFDEAVLMALDAGVDVITICHTLEKQRRAIALIADAIRSGRVSRNRVERSVARIDRLATRYERPVEFNAQVLDSNAHHEVMESITVTAAISSGSDPTNVRTSG